MILKSALQATIAEVLEENSVDSAVLADDLLDRLIQDFGEEIYDDDEDEDDEEEEGDLLGEDQ